jgi:hypothetical protein
VVIAVVLGMLMAAAGTGFAQPPPCINYVHHEEAGRVEVDLRFDPAVGTYSTLTIFWFIDDVAARPGIYNWSHLVNGRSLQAAHRHQGRQFPHHIPSYRRLVLRRHVQISGNPLLGGYEDYIRCGG